MSLAETTAQKAVRSVTVSTLGCKSNHYDSSALEDMLRESGLSVMRFPSVADAYIINTCTVTARTDSQSRQLIRRARRMNPSAIVIVTGCYAQVSSTEAAAIEGVDYVVGNPRKGALIEYLRRGRPESGAIADVGDYREGTPFTLRSGSSSGRTRANLKVQEGCSRNCSYCIIPMARGASKSLPLKEVLAEAWRLAGNGYREIILTGIHLGGYGADASPGTNIAGLLDALEREDLPCRFRLSSLDPDEVTDELIEFLKGSKAICPHLHLPLQSGDDSIIRSMRRPYTAAEFSSAVERLIESVPGISIGADVIAGFPGEGEAEFERTFSLLERLPVSYLHIFPYSGRRGTAAAGFSGQVDPKTVRERCLRLKSLDDEKRKAFLGKSIGRTAEALIEGSPDKKTGLMKGRTANYIQAYVDADASLRNTLCAVRLASVFKDGMKGVLV